MDCISLLAVTARLLDLHDSDREPGGYTAYVKEDRQGGANGLYLDIATSVVECLRAHDAESNQDSIPRWKIVERVARDIGANENDIMFVLGALSRPTELHYIDRSNPIAPALNSEKLRTVLIEKTAYLDEYRLSSSGRLLVSLSAMARDAAYLRGDAYNLLHAIEWCDFGKVIVFANEISGQLKIEILEIKSAIEKTGRSERVSKYIDRFEQYNRVIRETIEIVQKAEYQLNSLEVQDAFQAWIEKNKKDDMAFEALLQAVMRIRRTLTDFNRLVSELVSGILRHSRNAAPTISFLDLAAGYVYSPMPDHTQDFLLRQWGPVNLATAFFSPDDGKGAIQIRLAPEANNTVFEETGVQLVSSIGKLKFFDIHGKKIAEALKNGPISLSKAIDQGFFIQNDELLLGDLIGVFVAPDSLNIQYPITIRVASELSEKSLGQSGALLFTDIEICLEAKP